MIAQLVEHGTVARNNCHPVVGGSIPSHRSFWLHIFLLPVTISSNEYHCLDTPKQGIHSYVRMQESYQFQTFLFN